jgi:hypothetical protein
VNALNAFVAVAVSAASLPLVGQNVPPVLPPACGKSQMSMEVKLDKAQHAVAQPKPGTAQVYFVEDMGRGGAGYMTKIGMDGEWIGVNRKNSYFSVSVAPGEHHLCAAIEPSNAWSYVELAHFTAEVGKVYFYRTRIIVTRDGIEYFSLTPLDSDAGEYAVSAYPMAIARPKK